MVGQFMMISSSDYYGQIVALKNKGKVKKVNLAIGGWNDSEGDKYSVMVRDPAKR